MEDLHDKLSVAPSCAYSLKPHLTSQKVIGSAAGACPVSDTFEHDEDDEYEAEQDDEDDASEDEAGSQSDDDAGVEDSSWPAELINAVREAKAFMTQAKKQRSEVEKAR